jgi:hypothetical protein
MKTFLLTNRLLLAVSLVGVDYASAQTKAVLTAEPVHHTVVPGFATEIQIKTMADAVCALHPEDPKNGKQMLKLVADDEGMIRFYVRSASESEQFAGFVAECEAGGKVMAHHIELRAATAPNLSFPAPATSDPNLARQKGIVQPALEGDDLVLLSERELIRRGYPPRPDPQLAPTAYAAWRRAVSTPSIRVTPHTVPGSNAHNPSEIMQAPNMGIGNTTSSNWCGYANVDGYSPFNWVMGEWQVPPVYPEPARDFFGGTQTYSSEWIGLDGYGNNNVLQDGTRQDVANNWGGLWQAYSYSAFTQWFPADQQSLPWFPVHPGDDIFSEVWVGNADGLRNSSGDRGWFYLWNLTTGQNTGPMFVLKPLNAVFRGNSAEWIMERPMGNGVLSDLSQFNPTMMLSAAATRDNGDYLLYSQENSIRISMYNGNNLQRPLCTPDPPNPNSSSFWFHWGNFN